MFKYIVAMTTLDLSSNHLNTDEIDNILIYIYDYISKFASAVITLNNQLYVGTPSKNAGMSLIVSTIKSNTTLTTD